MTKAFIDNGKVLSLMAISREEDLKRDGRIALNPPPHDGRCQVCGRHLSEVEPFGGPGDPLDGDFTGELLVKNFRPLVPYISEAQEAWRKIEEKFDEIDEALPWFISNFGEEKGEALLLSLLAYRSTESSWECRRCIILHENEYFEKLAQRSN